MAGAEQPKRKCSHMARSASCSESGYCCPGPAPARQLELTLFNGVEKDNFSLDSEDKGICQSEKNPVPNQSRIFVTLR